MEVIVSNKYQVSHAAFVIWNYNARGDSSEDLQEKHGVAEVFFLTTDIISIRTNKDKAAPSGDFTVEMAPTRNWVSLITPGSWCAILMSNDRDAVKAKVADYKSLKMVGRITSCRAAYSSDQQTGAITTSIIVEGKDWGQVFETYIYIDPIFRGIQEDAKKSGAAAILSIFHPFFSKKDKDSDFSLMRVGDVIAGLKNIWGPTESVFSQLNDFLSTKTKSSERFSMTSGLLSFSKGGLTLPKEVAGFMSGAGLLAGRDTNIVTLIVDKQGTLTSYDEYDYSDTVNDGVGVPNLSMLLNTNTFWSILNAHINPVLNEVFVDLSWDGSKVDFCLYRRVKPFCLRQEFEGSNTTNIKALTSLFKNIKRHNIEVSDIVSFNAGTNWRDRVNFIELRSSLLDLANASSALKASVQIYDQESIDRDGFKAYPIQNTTTFYMPLESSNVATSALKDFANWKYLLKEWYFNTHTQLNGSIIAVGQDQYIGVGDNIMVSASVFGSGSFNSKIDSTKHFLLAHIESVSHSFAADANGTRQFFTTIRFVRGIFVDKDGNPIANGDMLSGVVGNLMPDRFSELVSSAGGPLPRALDPKSKDMDGVQNDTTANNITLNTSSNNPGSKK